MTKVRWYMSGIAAFGLSLSMCGADADWKVWHTVSKHMTQDDQTSCLVLDVAMKLCQTRLDAVRAVLAGGGNVDYSSKRCEERYFLSHIESLKSLQLSIAAKAFQWADEDSEDESDLAALQLREKEDLAALEAHERANERLSLLNELPKTD